MPHDTREAASGGEGWAQIPTSMLEQAYQHAVSLAQCALFVDAKALAKSMTDASAFLRQVSLFPASPAAPLTEEGASSTRTMISLKELSDAATPGLWYTVDTPWGDGTWIVAGNPDPHAGTMVCDCQDADESRPEDGPGADDDAAFIATLVTAYRLGELVPASLAPALETGEGSGGASPAGSGSQATPEAPSDLRPEGFDPSREAIRLQTISAVVKHWLDYDVQNRAKEGLETTADTHLISPPKWPRHGQLRVWIETLDTTASAMEAAAGGRDRHGLDPSDDSAAPIGETPEPLHASQEQDGEVSDV